jgi:nitrate reductase NapE component
MMSDTENHEKTVKFFGPASNPGTNLLTKDEQHEHFKKVLDYQLATSKDLQDLALRELKEGIRKAKTTQTWILALNIIMFFFGIVLISVAVYGGYTNMSPMYSVLFGGVGFAELVASFFIGAMQRSQKSVSDLVQIEVSFLNYFEQIGLWEQYAAVRDNDGNVQKENLAEAAKKIQESTAQTLELLQKYVEATNQ